MPIRWGRVIRDVALILVLTFFGGFVIGITAQSLGGKAPMGAIVVSNLVFGVIGFTISGCLVRVERFKHLTIVAVGVWLAGLVNVVFMGFPIGQWVAGIFLAFLMMGIGGAVSFLFVSAERQAQLMRCPFCAEEIRVEARVCKHCGREVAGARSAPTEPA